MTNEQLLKDFVKYSIISDFWTKVAEMAVAASALRNRNSHKMREGFESFLAKCVEASKDKNEVDLQFVMQTLESSNVKLDQKESARLQKICNNNNKINRSDLQKIIFFYNTNFF